MNRHSHSLPASLLPPPPANALPNYDVVAALLDSPEGQAALVPDTISFPRSLVPNHVLAINLGKNKTSAAESVDDYVNGVKLLGPYADILVINVSSPNTPGLRNLQKREALESLLASVVAARDELPSAPNPPVLVKIAPDLTKPELEDIAAAVVGAKIDGIVISNTTISRPPSAGTSPHLIEAGGLSGPPVKPLALAALKILYAATEGKVPLVGCGGISSGRDAVEFAKAGASLVQLYTGFIYGGLGLPRRIKDEVATILKEEGTTWARLVGSGHVEEKEFVVVEVEEEKKVVELIPIEEMELEVEAALSSWQERTALPPSPHAVIKEDEVTATATTVVDIVPFIPDPTEEVFISSPATPPTATTETAEVVTGAPAAAPTPASAVLGLLDDQTVESLLEELTKPVNREEKKEEGGKGESEQK